jgi:hypothetical protein
MASGHFSFPSGKQPCRVLVVQLRKTLDTLYFVGKRLWTAAQVFGFVQLPVGFYRPHW